jgi:hypothetical protein
MTETFARILAEPGHPWVALGDFLDDWRFADPRERPALVSEAIAPATEGDRELQRWAAFCAATTEWLCRQDGLPFPPWTATPGYRLAEPGFLYPGDLLKPWELVTTPAPFKMRNIFGGDHMLDRV